MPIGTFTPAGELTTVSGVLPSKHPFSLRVAGEMELTVGVGRAVIQGTEGQGAYPVAVTAPEPVTFAPGDAQFPRIDLVVLRVYDDPHDSTGEVKAVVEVIQGEPSANPTAPQMPGTTLPLYEIKVPAGASSGTGGIPWAKNVTDRRTVTVAAGGISIGPTPAAYPGQYREYGGILERSNGTDWEPVIRLGYAGRLELGDAGLYRSDTKTLATDQRFAAQVETTTSFTPLPNWRVESFEAKKTCGVVHIVAEVARTGSNITANAFGNIADEPLFIVPEGFRPTKSVEAIACDGYADGGAYFSSTGRVDLRSWSPNGVISGQTMRITPTYVL
ncbi:hypothetical protein [Streptomyces sp. NPDC045369]|uniref:hypothetical protein n=1 Tax=Streptomyces sp. NPDC045369 TaxID=3155732 RepID=UPI0033F0530B